MTRTRILPLFGVALVCLMYAGAPARAYDAAQGVRQSITESVRDDVRRRIQARDSRFRDSRAEYRYRNGELPKRKMRKGVHW